MARSPLHKTAFEDGRLTTPQYEAPTVARWASLCTAVLGLAITDASASTPPCGDWSAEVTAVEGSVEVRRSSATFWVEIATGEHVCRGDAVRVHAYARATITLPDQSTLRLDERTTLRFAEPPAGIGSLVDLVRGVIHVISRDPRSLQFSTPYANAGLEGTEFDIRVAEREARTEIAVLEGEVVVASASGSIDVPSGQLAVARAGQAPVASALAEPIDGMRWASYFPPIVAAPLPGPDEPPPDGSRSDATFFALRAAARLQTAEIDGAEQDLEEALRRDASHPTARALTAMITLARGDQAAARVLAAGAAAAAPTSAPAWIALSYAEQNSAELDAATRSIERAVAAEPDNPIAWTRLAELALARGDAEASLVHALRAQALDPTRSYAPTVMGFAHLSRLDADKAHAAFTQAVDLEPAAPLPRLGLALTLIQRGDLVEGRRQMEVAVALDPANALTRSYMGKVYEAENRNNLTGSQLELAKRFDPGDPTPWLYGALHKLRSNRPIEALQDLHAAMDRNGDRTVSRSRLAMDEDFATRSAGLGRLHNELGFVELARIRAAEAIAADPADYASHRLLADLYSTSPRHEIARVSELLVAQLLQPVNVTPIKAKLGQPTLFVSRSIGPSDYAFSEFASPLTKNGLQFEASSVSGGNSTIGEDVALAGVNGRLSYGAAQYRFATDGFRPNNDLDQRIGNAFIQYRPERGPSVQAEVRSVRTEQGELGLMFDPEQYNPSLRTNETADAVRLGLKQDVTERGTLLASVIYLDTASDIGTGTQFSLNGLADGYSVDLQHLYRGDRLRLQSGVVYGVQDGLLSATGGAPGGPTSTTTFDAGREQVTAYGYAHVRAAPTVTVTLGASADSLEDLYVEEDALSPKLGILWRPTDRTTVRAAAFQTTQGTLTTSRQNAQPRLEPVQIAGFNQLLFGAAADRSTVRGIGLDHTLSDRLFAGLELSQRDFDRTVLRPFGPPGSVSQSVATSERSQHAYLYWMPYNRLSVSAEYEHGRYHSGTSQLFGFSDMSLERVPIEVRYFAPLGVAASLRAAHVRQEGVFSRTPLPGGGATLAPGQDSFWVFDASLGYRLPNRRGIVALNVENLLDEQFRFQDIDPFNPRIMPERLVSLRFTVAFE